MKKIDDYGIRICKYQADLFQASLNETKCSSPVFLRRFMYSHLAARMDMNGFMFEAVDLRDAFDELHRQFGPSAYGRIRYDAGTLYWMGYLCRYWAYTRECSTKSIYRIIKPAELQGLYFPYHSLDPSLAIDRILESKNLQEEDPIEKGVRIMKKVRSRDSGLPV